MSCPVRPISSTGPRIVKRRFDHASSPEEKGTFKVLRDLWTALANESVVLSPDHLAKEIAAIEELQSKALGPDNISF